MTEKDIRDYIRIDPELRTCGLLGNDWVTLKQPNKQTLLQHSLLPRTQKPLRSIMLQRLSCTTSMQWTERNRRLILVQRHSSAYKMPTQRFTIYSKHSTLNVNNSTSTNYAMYIECQK